MDLEPRLLLLNSRPVSQLRELERKSSVDPSASVTLAIVGQGRMGTALASALEGTPYRVLGPLGRGSDGEQADAVLLCVPDGQIAAAAALISPGRLVGHCSGATGLDGLAPNEAFSLHPLMTVTDRSASFTGAGAAVDGTTPRAVRFARRLAGALGLRPVRVTSEDRALYHAAASMASNFLVTLEAGAEALAAQAGVERDLLVPLVRATVENWASLGPERALTGPVARRDEATVTRQREAIAERAPDVLELFDALVVATRSLAERGDGAARPGERGSVALAEAQV
jgi:predicted short-subunit dehydrogenase-like oxidoreductase (DUF2520 family)